MARPLTLQEMANQGKNAAQQQQANRPPGYMPGNVRSGGNQQDVGFLDALTGDEMYTAGVPGYHGELAEQDKQNALNDRRRQKELGSAIQDRALGRGGPSVAELQMQRGMNTAQRNLRSQAVSGRGMNRAGAQRAALRGASDMYMGANEQAGIMRAQEQIGAQQLASQHYRDMRQQDLLSRGYGIEEAKAILDAEMKAQDINAKLAGDTAGRRQGIAIAGIGALAGLASDRNAKEVMYSDFTGKEPLTGRESMLNVPSLPAQQPSTQTMGASGYGFQPMLQTGPATALDSSVADQQKSMGERAMAGAAGSGQSSLADNAQAGFNIGSALGGLISDMRAKELMPSDFKGKELGKARVARGSTFDTSPERVDRMGRFEVEDAKRRFREREAKADAGDLWRYRHESAKLIDRRFPDMGMSSDFRGKEPTMGELDQAGEDAMLPFREMDAQDSREALAPVEPVVYRYNPEHAARMAGEQDQMAELRARYAGLGGETPEEHQAIQQGTYQDKRKPRLGIIAQDLQQSPAFRNSVVSTPAGLAVQRDRALSTALGSLAGIDKRLRELEDVGDTQAGKIRGESKEKSRERRLLESRY